jgi:hypothetical protein
VRTSAEAHDGLKLRRHVLNCHAESPRQRIPRKAFVLPGGLDSSSRDHRHISRIRWYVLQLMAAAVGIADPLFRRHRALVHICVSMRCDVAHAAVGWDEEVPPAECSSQRYNRAHRSVRDGPAMAGQVR